MTKLQLNNEQQRVLELLNKRCEKVELYLNQDDQKEAMCLLEDKKVIEVTFYEEDKLCVTYHDFEQSDEYSQETMYNYELDNSFINRMLKRVVNSIDHVEYYANQAHAQRVKEFLNN